MKNEEIILANVRKYPIVQLVNKKKDVTVTFRMKNGLCFITNVFEHELPLSTYLNFDDLQNKLKPEEIIDCCRKAINEGGWKFHFWKENI